jgi:hypothetical protein
MARTHVYAIPLQCIERSGRGECDIFGLEKGLSEGLLPMGGCGESMAKDW